MKNFDEHRNFYKDDGLLGGASGDEDSNILPQPKTFKEYAIAKVLKLDKKVEIPYAPKELLIKADLDEWEDAGHGEWEALIVISKKDLARLAAIEGAILGIAACFSDGSQLGTDFRLNREKANSLIYTGGNAPEISDIILKFSVKAPAYEPKTFAEHALAVYIEDERIADIPATLAPKTTIELYLAEAIDYGDPTVDQAPVSPGK